MALNKYLPKLKKREGTEWLSECYSQVLPKTGAKTSKYQNPRHLAKHERNLAKKQVMLARKQKGSKSREKARKLVAKVHERISNARQDYLHKLSRKLVDDNQVNAS